MKENSHADKYKPYVPMKRKDYTFFYDNNGKLRRFRNDTPSKGIRLWFLEKPYFWWKSQSVDFRNAMIPLGLSFFFFCVVYFPTVWAFERKEKVRYIATIPEDIFDKSKFEEYKKMREQEDEKEL